MCYGYKRSPENKNKLVVDTEIADVIKLIFNLYEQGNGVTKIAQILYDIINNFIDYIEIGEKNKFTRCCNSLEFLGKTIVILGILWYNIKVLKKEILGGFYMSNEENYIIENEITDTAKKQEYWNTGIGLNKVDSLEPSKYLLDLSQKKH